MKHQRPLILSLLFAAAACLAQENDGTHTFSNAEGKTLTDRLIKYDIEKKEVLLEKSGRVPLDTFTEADQAYILHWNQVEGFKSSMRLKLEIKKDNWARLKHEQNITPYYMDAIQIPGKKTPNHHIVLLENYEEYNAVYLEADGFELKLRNQNPFPLENLVVESKVFYEQELYTVADSLFYTGDNAYFDTITTNKVRFLSETIPVIVQHEEVLLHSECAIIVDHQVERTSLASKNNKNNDNADEEEVDDGTAQMEGFGDWDDHARRRKGRVLGAWFRVGMEDPDGKMVWREITSPSSLDKKVSWDAESAPEQSTAAESE